MNLICWAKLNYYIFSEEICWNRFFFRLFQRFRFRFQISAVFFGTFYLSKFLVLNNHKCSLSSKSSWSNDAENSALITGYKLHTTIHSHRTQLFLFVILFHNITISNDLFLTK